jgi:hypothetical protein
MFSNWNYLLKSRSLYEVAQKLKGPLTESQYHSLEECLPTDLTLSQIDLAEQSR